jgi:hypothetical protein
MRIRISLLALGLIFSFPLLAHAQFNGGNQGGNSSFGGQTGGVSTGLGGSSGSSSGRSGTTTGSGTFGSRSLGGGLNPSQSNFSGNRQQGAGKSASGVGNPGNIGQLDGNERFTKQGRQGGAFVGSDSRDTSNVLGGLMAGAQMAAFQGGGRNRGQDPNQNQNQQGGNTRTTRSVRAVRSVDFAYAAPRPTQLGKELSQRLTNTKALESRTGVNVTIEGRTAILKGVVQSQHARELAERLSLLEPGVSAVRNELTLPEELSPPPTP